jgi:hypothetical protein
MLSKLFKYEIKATARTFLPIYIVFLAYSIIYNIISHLSPSQWKAPEVISLIIYIMMFVGMMVMTLIVMIQRFYKNLLADEGYLMFTLPTKPWKHITSKLIVSIIWTAASSIVALISICIIAFNRLQSEFNIDSVIDSINKFFSEFGMSTIPFFFEVLLLCLIGLASNVLIIYASIAIGHLVNKHRVISSLGAFIALSAATQILMTVIGVILDKSPLPAIGFRHGEIFTTNPVFHLVFWCIIIFFGLISAGYFILTNYILSRHLNLE